jgi:hypothetical protein
VGPKFLAGGRIERYQSAVFRSHVGDIVDYERAERVTCLIAGLIAPGDFQLSTLLLFACFSGE